MTVGMKARFVPSFDRGMNDSPAEIAAKTITGTICYINFEHKYFTVEFAFGTTKQKESFKFCDIDKAVKVIG